MGCCIDNHAEGIWQHSSIEKFAHLLIGSDTRSDVIHYIEMFYNSHRLHSYLKYKNPNDFEKSFMLAKTA